MTKRFSGAVSARGSRRLLKSLLQQVRVSLTGLVCAVVAFQPMMAELAYAQQVIIDPNGNVGFAPSIQRAAPPVVDIATPNSGGVSLNQYTEFNVGTGGLVLNNSQGATSTHVAGAVAGNPNLSGGTAGVIVNEVTSTAQSSLRGAVEVAGDRADVVIANPNGLLCDGCSFINAGEGTLTTGVPTITGGQVQLDVTRGTVTIGRKGLRGEAGQRGAISGVNLIGRTVVVDGRVTAIDGITIQGGAASYDLNSGARTATLTGEGGATYAVDATAFGAMEANRIQVIGNERGLGVRTLGAIQTDVNDVVIRSEGDVTARSVSAQGRVDIRANYGDLVLERDVISIGANVFAYARYDTTVDERAGVYGATGVKVWGRNQSLTFDGIVQSGADVELYSRQPLYFGAYGNAVGDFELKSVNGVEISDATIVANTITVPDTPGHFLLEKSALFSTADVVVTPVNLTLGQDVVVEGLGAGDVSNLNIAASGNFTNAADLRRHTDDTLSYAGNLVNEATGLIEQAVLNIAAGKAITNRGILIGSNEVNLNVASLSNEETGSILSGGRMRITASGDISNDGSLTSDEYTYLTASGSITNAGYAQGLRAYLTAPVVNQTGGGELRAQDYLSVAAATSFDNAGILASTGSMVVTGGVTTNAGAIVAETTADIRSDSSLTNTGSMTAGNSLVLRAPGLIRNDGDLVSYNGLTIAAESSTHNYGRIIADGGLNITGDWFQNMTAESLLRSKGAGLLAKRIRNAGEMHFFDEFRRGSDLEYFDNDGVLTSAGRIRLETAFAGNTVLNRAGAVMVSGLTPETDGAELELGDYTRIIADSIENYGRIASGGSIYLTSPNNLTVEGTLNARQHVLFDAANVTVAEGATVQADLAGFVTTDGTFANNGNISLDGYLRLTGTMARVVNTGYLGLGNTSRMNVDGVFDNSGVIMSDTHLTLKARTLLNSGHIQAEGNISLLGEVTVTDAAGVASVENGTMTHLGTLSATGQVTARGDTVSLNNGSYIAATQLQITSRRFINQTDAVLTGTARNTWTVAEDIRQQGTTWANGEIRATADQLLSYAGSQLATDRALVLTLGTSASITGALSGNTLTLTAPTIQTNAGSSLWAAGDLRLTSTGRTLTQGEVISGDDLYVTAGNFDLRGNSYGKRVHLTGAANSYNRGKLIAEDTITANVTAGNFWTGGVGTEGTALTEAGDGVTVDAGAITVAASATVRSTEVRFDARGGIGLYGSVFGASSIDLQAESTITNQAGATLEATSLAVTTPLDFINRGLIDVYGFYGDVRRNARNEKDILVETYFGLDAGTFQNRTSAKLISDEHIYLNVAGATTNYSGARIQGLSVDIRGGSVDNHGILRGTNVLNMVELSGAITNRATGHFQGKKIVGYAGSYFNNYGRIGQRSNAALPVTNEIYLRAAAGNFRNEKVIDSAQIRIEASGAIINTVAGDMIATGALGLNSTGSYVHNLGEWRGNNVVVQAAGSIENFALVRATDRVAFEAGSHIKNRVSNGSNPDIRANRIVMEAGGRLDNHGRIQGYNTLGLQARDDLYNNGVITGPDMTLISTHSGVWSPAAISGAGTLNIQGRSIGLRNNVTVTNEVNLQASHYNIEVEKRIATKRLLIETPGELRGNYAVFRGSDLTQLVAGKLVRFDGAVNRQLRTIYGANKDIYVELTGGSIGTMGSDVYNYASGHGYDFVDFNVTGGVSIKASGNILLAGRTVADKDIYVEAGGHLLLGQTGYTRTSTATTGAAVQTRAANPAVFNAGEDLVLKAGGLLKNYIKQDRSTTTNTPTTVLPTLVAGNRVHLLAGGGWFYSKDWLKGENITHSLSVAASTIIIDSSHRFVNRDIYLAATNDIRQNDQVISARQVTYSAGRDILIRFNPFNWRAANSTAANTGDWWDTDSAGLRGHNLLSQSRGMQIYAGRDLTLRSGKVQSGGAMTLTAGRTFLSEPMYLENQRWNRPSYVGWSFSSKYKGVQSGHDASKVDIRELRAYENRIVARDDLTIIAGAHANFIGSYVQSSYGDIAVDALTGGVNMVAAPGFWTYNYRNRTVKKKFFGFYRKTTTYELDESEDIYKRSDFRATRGNITIRSTGSNGSNASIISAGTGFTANNIYLRTPNGNITSGDYAERSITREETHSSTRIFWVLPFGSSDSTEVNRVLVNYGSEFLADELLSLSAPQGTLTLSGGTRITARTVNIEAARLNIQASINSTRQSLYSRRDNMVTITTIQSGFDRETAILPEINAPNINFNISGEIHIAAYRGATLNSQLINVIGSHTFDDETLGLASPSDQAAAAQQSASVQQDFMREFTLPGADDGAQFAYLDTLVADPNATVEAILLRDHEWYDKQVQLNPAFKALLQAVATYITGGLNFNLGSAFLNAGASAATTSTIVGVVEGTITGNFDMDEILRGALLAGASGAISSAFGEIDWGAGLSDASPFANDVSGTFSASALVDRLGDRITNQIVTNIVYGNDPFDGFDQLGRSFLVSETMALAQFGIGELGNGQGEAWEGSVGHLLLHGGVGCLALEAMNGDCVAGFFSGAASSLLAGSNLTDEQKLALAPLVSALAAFPFSGGEAINVAFASTIGQSAIVNNYLTHADLTELELELAQCRAQSSSNECEGDALSTIMSKYAAISFQRDVAFARCRADPSCDTLELIAETPMGDPRSAALIGSITQTYGEVGSFVELVAFRNGNVTGNQSPFLRNFREEFAWKEANCGGLSPVDCNVAYFEMTVARGESVLDGAAALSMMMGGTAVVRALISRGLGAQLLQACQKSPICVASMTTVNAVDTVNQVNQCLGGNALACGEVLVPAAVDRLFPGNLTRTEVDNIFADSRYSSADYLAYVARKEAAGETPRDPADYIEIRSRFDRGSAAHTEAVELELVTLDTTYPTANVQRELTFSGSTSCGTTTCRPDIVVFDANTGTLHVIEVKTGDADLTPNQTAIYPQIADGSAYLNATQLDRLGLPTTYAGAPISDIPEIQNIIVEEVRR